MSVTLKLVDVATGQLINEVTNGGVEDTKKYGITNPAELVPFEKEYFLLGQIEWDSDEFHQTLLGKAVCKGLVNLATALNGIITDTSMVAQTTPVLDQLLGLEMQELTDELAQKLGYEDRGGVLIIDVKGGSPADLAGLQKDDLIQEVNRSAVKNVKEFR